MTMHDDQKENKKKVRKPLPKFKTLKNTSQHGSRGGANDGADQQITNDPQCQTNDCPAD
jgi:hypothetical protein